MNDKLESRAVKIRSLVARGLRGGLRAGQHLGSDEVHHLCELLDLEYKANDALLIELREHIENAMNEDNKEDYLTLAHGIVLTLTGEPGNGTD